MVEADRVLGGSGPMVSEAFPIKKGYDPMERRNGIIKPKQKAGNAILGWVAPGTGLVDKQFSEKSLVPPPNPAARVEWEGRLSGQLSRDSSQVTLANTLTIVIRECSSEPRTWLIPALLSPVGLVVPPPKSLP